MSKDLTEYEIIMTNMKWDKWYPNYVEYRKSRDENFEYVISLTPKKKRQIMSDWIKNSKIDFCFPGKEIDYYHLPTVAGVNYEARRKNNRPWRATYKREHIDYFQSFDQAVERLKAFKIQKEKPVSI